MTNSLLGDAFAHHVWATLRLLDACGALSREQLETPVEGTYGSILATARHVVGGDTLYLRWLRQESAPADHATALDLPALRAMIEHNGVAWSAFLARDPSAMQVVKDVDEHDGWQRDASVGLRLAQALYHGTDHRSQICTGLTKLGVEPPGIEVWDFGRETGRVVDIQPVPQPHR